MVACPPLTFSYKRILLVMFEDTNASPAGPIDAPLLFFLLLYLSLLNAYLSLFFPAGNKHSTPGIAATGNR